jgi:quinoprotein glucose dehydrogenase
MLEELTLRKSTLIIVVVCMSLTLACGSKRSRSARQREVDWPNYGNDAGGMRFSPLTQINRNNVGHLKLAWIYHTGDISDGSQGKRKSEFEATPILVGGTLYLSTAFNRVVALDPVTGGERWSYDPTINLTSDYSEGLMNRGVSAWLDPDRKPGDPCQRRIFIGTIDARLIALDAVTGRPCADFGKQGQVDLTKGLRADSQRAGEYEETSPPAIIDNLVVVGSGIADNDRVNMPSGVVRAFDARTGALRWSWEPIPPNHSAVPPRPSDPNAWFTGAANAWAPMAVDPARDLVFVPTGSASPDYWGGFRKGDDKWADSLVALRGKTGEFVWGFQLVHHDLWDYDTAAPPLLATLHRNGKEIPVVVEGNKTGMLYVLNRGTGEPVFPVKERSVPQSHALGEQTSPTQPFPEAPPPLTPQQITAADAWGLTAEEREACRKRMGGLESDGIFTPPSVKGIIAFPGNLGGMNWSGYAFDPQRQILVTFTDSIAMEVHLIPRDRYLPIERAAQLGKFRAEVSPQHGAPYGFSRAPILSPQGLPCNSPPWGSLVAVDLATGKTRWSVPLGTSQDYIPRLSPPIHGMFGLGGPIVTAGGLIFIAGEVGDNYLRAFDIETGKELWKGRLPVSGQATPMTYEINDKQYVVIAAGGHGKLGDKLGDSLVAFALP